MYPFVLKLLVCAGLLGLQWQGAASQQTLVALIDGAVGRAGGPAGGWAATGSANVQFKRNLITLRASGTSRIGVEPVLLGLLAFPVPVRRQSLNEYALLYGWAFKPNRMRSSFSLGYAHNNFTRYLRATVSGSDRLERSYGGLAFEASIGWLSAGRPRIPFLSPLVSSVGFRLFGNLSRNTFVGIGAGLGLGYRKQD